MKKFKVTYRDGNGNYTWKKVEAENADAAYLKVWQTTSAIELVDAIEI